MKKIMGIIGLLANLQGIAAPQPLVFVSFSMPDQLLEQTLQESTRYHWPIYLNGFHHDSLPETIVKIKTFVTRIPNLNLLIDPTQFERFGIQQVPALVVETRQGFDMIYGHLSLKEAIFRIASLKNDSGLTLQEAKRIMHGH